MSRLGKVERRPALDRDRRTSTVHDRRYTQFSVGGKSERWLFGIVVSRYLPGLFFAIIIRVISSSDFRSTTVRSGRVPNKMTGKFILFAFLDAICAVSANIVQNTSFVCPNEFVRCGNSCYFLSRRTASWQEAFFECTNMAHNSNLAILDNKWKDQNVRDYLQNPNLPQIKRWIGGIYDWKQLKWIWGSTGQRIQYQAFSRRKKEDNQPWKCAFMNPNNYHRWSTDDCTRENYFICEAPAKSLINSINYIKYS